MKPPVYALIDFKVRAENLGNARKHMRKVEKEVRALSGVLQYHFLQDLDDPTVFTGYGIFASNAELESFQAAMEEASMADPALRNMMDQDRLPELRRLDRV